jgi:segregation and condensation protein B
VADENEGQGSEAEGQESQEERQEGSKAEGPEGSHAEAPDSPEGLDGLESQEGHDRREANEGVQEGESLPKRAAAELKAILEALIFASPDPLTPKAMFKLLDTEPKEDVQAALVELKHDYDRPGGLQLVEVAGGYQIVTRSDLHEWVRRLFNERTTQKLTVQGLETLAVIAYRQPITAAEITEVRGVNTSGVLNTLLERHLIKIVGRKQVVGRPFMYATTKEFLIRFGLNDLTDLPKVEDMAEALGLDAPILIEQTPSEEMLPLDEPEGDDETPSEEPGSVH